MTIRKLILLSIFLIAVSKPVSGQNFVNAYLVDLKGDTLEGKVFVPDNDENYLRINFFKWGDMNNAKQYKPENISEYGYGYGQVFRSFRLSNDTSVTEKKNVFLKVLIDQPELYSLFVFRNTVGEVTYFVKGGEYNLTMLSPENYKELLGGLTGDCVKVTDQNPDNLNYTTSDLANFINAYNSCKDSTYVVDELYLSDGVRNFGLRFGTGFGPFLSKRYKLDLPDLTIALRMDYSLNKNNSLVLEAGFSKRTMTYTYDQMGSVSVYSIPKVSNYGEVKSKSKVDGNLVYANVMWKKKLDKMYYGIAGGMAVKLNTSEIKYAAVIKDEEFKNQLEWNAKVEDEYRIVNLIPSFQLIAGMPVQMSSQTGNLEFSIGYLNVKADNEEWTYSEVPSKVLIMDKKNYPYVEYTLDKPKMPKLVFDISFVVPVFE